MSVSENSLTSSSNGISFVAQKSLSISSMFISSGEDSISVSYWYKNRRVSSLARLLLPIINSISFEEAPLRGLPSQLQKVRPPHRDFQPFPPPCQWPAQPFL